jgi:cytochrome c55X
MRLRTERSWTLSTAAVTFVVVLSGSAAAEPAFDPAKLSNLVRQDCGSCHGLTLKGGLGKPLTPEHLAQWDREQLVHIILDGVPGTPMPPWRPLLTEAEARWIAEALHNGALR